MVAYAPNQGDLERRSDAAQAAHWLADLGDQTIRAELEKRFPSAKGDDRALYEAALKNLRGKE